MTQAVKRLVLLLQLTAFDPVPLCHDMQFLSGQQMLTEPGFLRNGSQRGWNVLTAGTCQRHTPTVEPKRARIALLLRGCQQCRNPLFTKLTEQNRNCENRADSDQDQQNPADGTHEAGQIHGDIAVRTDIGGVSGGIGGIGF